MSANPFNDVVVYGSLADDVWGIGGIEILTIRNTSFGDNLNIA